MSVSYNHNNKLVICKHNNMWIIYKHKNVSQL